MQYVGSVELYFGYYKILRNKLANLFQYYLFLQVLIGIHRCMERKMDLGHSNSILYSISLSVDQ